MKTFKIKWSSQGVVCESYQVGETQDEVLAQFMQFLREVDKSFHCKLISINPLCVSTAGKGESK